MHQRRTTYTTHAALTPWWCGPEAEGETRNTKHERWQGGRTEDKRWKTENIFPRTQISNFHFRFGNKFIITLTPHPNSMASTLTLGFPCHPCHPCVSSIISFSLFSLLSSFSLSSSTSLSSLSSLSFLSSGDDFN